MTKQFSPEITGTELIGTDYIRSDDGAIMRDDGHGSFNAVLGSFEAPKIIEPTPRVKPSSKRRKQFRGVVHIASNALADVCFDRCEHFRFRHTLVAPPAVNRFRCTITSAPRDRLRLPPSLTPPGLRDATKEAAVNRAEIERYNAKRPEKDYPEHTMYPRGSRNASPTRKKDAKQLNAFWEYRALNESTEPLQTNYLQADNDNYGYDKGSSVLGGDDTKKPLRSAEAEWEMRPSVQEMEARWSVPTVKYETRQVGLITGPRLSDCGYCMAPTSPLIREMKIPVSGDIECIGIRKGIIPGLEDAATKSMWEYRRRQAAFPMPTRPRAKDPDDEKQIGIVVGRTVKLLTERLNIAEVDTSERWSIRRIGDLYFAPYGTKQFCRGEVVNYASNGGMYPAKDEYGTPYGSESVGSNDAAWVPLHPRKSKSGIVMLSPAARARQLANKNEPIPCQKASDEMLEAFRLKPEANGKPANDNRHYDGLPYDVESRDELQFGYAFGKKYPETHDPEPFADVVERKNFSAVFDAGLSPQTRRGVSMVVLTDGTEMLAQNEEDLGAALWTGRGNPSVSTLKRHGKKAKDDIAKELGKRFQELAA
jgi:hypothetical protein